MDFTHKRGTVILFLFPRYSYQLITETWIYSTHASCFHKKSFWVLVDMEEITMISDVILKNKTYYVLDERGKEISHRWDHVLGELLDFSGMYMVFRKGGTYYSYDEQCKEIAHKWESSLGEFRSIAGDYMTFRKNRMIYTMDRYFKEISQRRE